MSEHDDETQRDDDAQTEQEFNEIPDDDSAGDDGAEVEPDSEQGVGGSAPEAPDEEAPQSQGMTEQEMEKALDKIGKRRTTFYNAVADIMGEGANDLVECPACSHFVPGLIFPQPFAPDTIGQLWPYLGLPNPNELQDAPDRHVCTVCQGRGRLNSGSLIPEYATVNCRACAGRGYTDDQLPVQPEANGNVALVNGNGEVVPPMPEDEAWIQAARERGYTIVPPIAQPHA